MKDDKYKLHEVDKVINDIVKLIKKTHDIKQKVDYFDNYKGSDIMKGSDALPLKEKINKETWEFNNYGNGSDRAMIEMIIESVFSMGFQQGERYCRKETDYLHKVLETLTKKLN